MTLADCRRPLFACSMIYRSSPAVVVLGRPPPIFLTAVPVVWNAFQARETTLLLIPNSAATLVTVFPRRKARPGLELLCRGWRCELWMGSACSMYRWASDDVFPCTVSEGVASIFLGFDDILFMLVCIPNEVRMWNDWLGWN
ncbi:structural maintenance of chromosomes protein 2-2 [Trichonephila clavipes]|nr:structural maintenance of chromosomes protein 2-2 [Trichonephila clavipes]